LKACSFGLEVFVRIDLLFSLSAFYFETVALTAHPVFFAVSVIASVYSSSRADLVFRASALYSCSSALTAQSCYGHFCVIALLL
jgi:hypothetical protein